MRHSKITSAVNRALNRLIKLLTDPDRRDRAVIAVLASYALAWTVCGIISKSNQDLHPDMTELIAWSRDLALGFPKHPPFAAAVVRSWFALFPITGRIYYLLAMLIPTLALWVAWQLFADYLNPKKRLLALALLTFIPFYNFLALKFNVNTVLMPLWAATTFWFLRSYRTRSPAYAALTGIGAAFCLTCKYWSGFLLVGLVVAALFDSRRGAYFRSSAPWLTILMTIVFISPHISWLERHNFSPMQYAMLVHSNHPLNEMAWADIRYYIDSMAYLSVPIAVVLLATRPSLRTIADMVWPVDRDRRLLAVVFGATLLLPILVALPLGIEIHGIWSMSNCTLFPVLLLPRSVQIPRLSARLIVASAIALPLFVLIAAPGSALYFHLQGLPPKLTQTKMLAEQVEHAWQSATVKPLRHVGGDADLAYGVITYAHDRPQALPDLPQPTATELRRNGMALVCYAEDTGCTDRSSRIASANPASQKIGTELKRNYLGFAGLPQRYLIFVLPPQEP